MNRAILLVVLILFIMGCKKDQTSPISDEDPPEVTKDLIYQQDFSSSISTWTVTPSYLEDGNIRSVVVKSGRLEIETHSNTAPQSAYATYNYESNIKDIANLKEIYVTISFIKSHFLSTTMNNSTSFLRIDFGKSRFEISAQPYFGFYLHLVTVKYSYVDKTVYVTDTVSSVETELDVHSYTLKDATGFYLSIGSKSWAGTDICPTCGGSNTTSVDRLKIETVDIK